MTDETERVVLDALRRHARSRGVALEAATRLADVVDSLRLILVVLELHRTLGRRPFDAAQTSKLATVGDLVAAVRTGGSL